MLAVMKLPVSLVLCFVAPISAISERPVQASQSSSPTQSSTSQQAGQFYDKELDIHFDYPAEMRVLDGAADMDSGHMEIYGVSGKNDPEHQEAKRCMRFLLDTELPPSEAPKRMASLDGIWVDDTKEYKDSRRQEPIFAKIVFVDFDKSCLSKSLQKNKNDALGNLAMSVVSAPGLQKIPHPLWYKVGGQKIHMNCGIGRLIVNGKLAPAPIVVMSMAAEWHGHLLLWVFM
ncbi:MAG: hypothetical protein ACRELF_22125, partial [Gemmataceae bacterium]